MLFTAMVVCNGHCLFLCLNKCVKEVVTVIVNILLLQQAHSKAVSDSLQHGMRCYPDYPRKLISIGIAGLGTSAFKLKKQTHNDYKSEADHILLHP